jgi:hypothetical protein
MRWNGIKAMIDESCCKPRACMLMLLVVSLYDTYVDHENTFVTIL